MKTLAIDLIEEYTYLEHMNNPFEGQELNTAHTFALTTTTHNGDASSSLDSLGKATSFGTSFLRSLLSSGPYFLPPPSSTPACLSPLDPSTRECPPMKDCWRRALGTGMWWFRWRPHSRSHKAWTLFQDGAQVCFSTFTRLKEVLLGCMNVLDEKKHKFLNWTSTVQQF